MSCVTNLNLCLFQSGSKSKSDLAVSRLRRQHFLNFGTSVFFSSLMMVFDIASDIATGVNFLNSGDLGWATFTFVIICTPWLARSLISLTNIRMCFNFASTGKTFSHERYLVWKDEMVDSLLEFPLFQPFRFAKRS